MIAESSLASVICGTEELMESDYMSINENDVIGVSVPSTAPLPIVASSASGYNLKMFSDGGVTTVDSAQLVDMPNHALHLSADISKYYHICIVLYDPDFSTPHISDDHTPCTNTDTNTSTSLVPRPTWYISRVTDVITSRPGRFYYVR